MRKESNDPSPEMKRKMMASWGGIFPFTSDPPFHLGQIHRTALGFWLCDAQGQITKVSGQTWFNTFPPRTKPRIGIGKTAMEEQELGTTGGRIVIGLSKVQQGEEDLARIEEYMPSLITDVLAPELPGSGWTIGRFGHGRYVADDGTVFNERSIMIVIAGITTPKLKLIARLLARHLNQNCVLVFDDNNGKTSLIGQDEPKGPPTSDYKWDPMM